MASIDEALGVIRSTLEADGYQLKVERAEGVLRLSVIAGEGTCEDCLVPKDIILMIVKESLADNPEIRDVELRYPHD